MDDARRLQHSAGPAGRDLLSPDFQRFFVGLHDRFAPRVALARRARGDAIEGALHGGRAPGALAASEARGDWQAPPLPEALTRPGIEISGPVSITSMAINALNPGPEGVRAVGYLDDDEDSAGHRLEDTLQAARNRCAALDGRLEHFDAVKDKHYELAAGTLPFFVHRERGWHLDEPEVTIDGEPVSASLLGTALTLFHAGRRHAALGQSIHFYLPKLESAEEAALHRDVFDHCMVELPYLSEVPLRAIALVESLPAVWCMEEILHALGPYAGGLNAARWDLKASLLEFAMNDPAMVWPDRFDVDIKTTPFLSEIFRRLVAFCGKHGAVPIGGMATALPSRDDEVNRQAAAAIAADKKWEAEQGFVRGWVAHIHHMATAAAPFERRWSQGFDPKQLPVDPARHPIRIERPAGMLSEDGTRRNLRTLLEYLHGWLGGRGAVAIDSLEGRPGKRPALMEDLATARISAAQTAQRLVHEARCEDTGRVHDARLVRKLADAELHDVLRLRTGASADARRRYEEAQGIALAWVRRMADFDFRSLGSFSREELRAQAQSPAL